jgi:hypothetical protein
MGKFWRGGDGGRSGRGHPFMRGYPKRGYLCKYSRGMFWAGLDLDKKKIFQKRWRHGNLTSKNILPGI